MSNSSSEESPASAALTTASTTTTEQILSGWGGSAQMANSILMPTVSSASSPAYSPGEPASSPASAEKSSKKPSLKSRREPDAMIEEHQQQQAAQGQQPRVVKVKKEDLQAFIQMMSEFQEIIESK
jgi:hypothetical protein